MHLVYKYQNSKECSLVQSKGMTAENRVEYAEKLVMYLVYVCQHCRRWVAHPLWTSRNSVEDFRTPDSGEWQGHPGMPGPSLDKPSPPGRLQLQGAKVKTNSSTQAASHYVLQSHKVKDIMHFLTQSYIRRSTPPLHLLNMKLWLTECRDGVNRLALSKDNKMWL